MTKPSPHYYPFGSLISNRSWSDASRVYRYGFNGKEKDFETSSDNYDFGARIYDGRLGKWLSLDPLMKRYVHVSSFQYCENSPIAFIDIDGKEIKNGYNPVTDKELYIKVQTAIEMFKLTFPEMYKQYNEDPTIKITVTIDPKLSNDFKEASANDGFGGTSSWGGSEINSDVIGKATVPYRGVSNVKFSLYELDENGEVKPGQEEQAGEGTTRIYKKVSETIDGNIVEKWIEVTDQVEIDKIKNGISINKQKLEIKIDDGVNSPYLLGKIFTHEINHIKYDIENPAKSFIEGSTQANDNTSSEQAAYSSEKDYDKNYKSSYDKQATESAKNKAGE